MPNNLLEIEELKDLSEEERKYALEILKEISKNGTSEKLNKIMYEDYEEIPVLIEEFLHNPLYLGKALTNEDGRWTLFPYWEECLKKIFPNNVDVAYNTGIFTGAIGLGKAQPLYSKILTDKGFVNMGDIKIGDNVFGDDGKTHKVIGVFPQGKKKVYDVVFTDRSKTRCCDEHLWNVRRVNSHNKEYKTVELKDIMSKKLSRRTKDGWNASSYSIPMCSPVEFKHKDLFIDPYVMGCLLGDGGLSQDGIKFTSKDEEIVESLNCLVEKNGYIFNHTAGKFGYNLRRIKHKNIPNEYAEEIRRYSLNKTSEYKTVPDDYKFNDVETRLSVLQGLMDTDGYCDKDGYSTFTTVSKQLAEDVVFIVQSLGGNAPVRIKNNRKYKTKDGNDVMCKTAFEVTVKLPKPLVPFRLQRKLSRLKETRKEPVRCIKEISYVGEEECQCILLDSKSHLYLTDDFIVTHNSTIAVIVILYQLYKLMCLKNPYTHYKIQEIDTITVAFMNITKDAAASVAWSKCQNMLKKSKWFMDRGTLSKGDDPQWKPPHGIELIYGSQSRHIIGRAVFACFFDEISFIPNQDVEAQKKKAKDLVQTAAARMQSRFMKGEKNPTILMLASSKRTEQSYLETFIEQKKRNESKTTLIVDEPQWVIRTDKDSSRKFKVAIGNKFLNSELLPLNISDADLKIYRDKGFQILEVPMGYYENFLDDIDIALTDIAGISTTSLSRYISGQRIAEIKKPSLKNPFVKDVIEVGNNPKDYSQYWDYFNMDYVDKSLIHKPLYIHMDMSVSGDKTGIAGVWIIGKSPPKDGHPESKDLYYRLVFSVSVKAPKGYQISFEKNRQFIYWLREQGFSIKGITTDTFQSVDTGQSLTAKGFKYEPLSVDRVDTDHICKPYQYLKSTIYEERLEMYDSVLLTEELIGLERDNNSGKIDHSPSGINSKDCADALCGAIFNASKHAEEYAFDYGETIDSISEVSSSRDYESDRKQLSVDFEHELGRLFDPMATPEQVKRQKANQPDLVGLSLLNDGILVL